MSGSTARMQAIAAVTSYKPFSSPMNFAEIPVVIEESGVTRKKRKT